MPSRRARQNARATPTGLEQEDSSMRTRILLVVVSVGLIGAYGAGYWRERQQRRVAEADAERLRSDLDAATAKLLVGNLLGRALTLKEIAESQNYAQARELSSSFFDDVRVESMAVPNGALREGLSQTLAKRDAVTAALAKGDPVVVGDLHAIELQLRQALGYPTPPARPAPAATAATPR
jgi:hypothetical protein